jgi:hypothetical protein
MQNDKGDIRNWFQEKKKPQGAPPNQKNALTGESLYRGTVTVFWLKCFKIMAWKSGFHLKVCYCGFGKWLCHFLTMKNNKGDMRLQFQVKKNSWKKFQIQITPLLWRSQGPQGCLEKRNCPLSSNLAVWCTKIGPKTQKLQKTVKKPSFFVVFHVISEVFWRF